ncbi:MAG: metal ABC transporter permease [Anaerolineaceae bacterium]|nr:metal ABC transporter permease [Anaerolineaceae bacterium]
MFELLQHPFVQNAFLSGTIVAIVSGVIGYFVVLRGQAFACEALSHVGFAGATFAALLGIPALFGMLAFTLLAAAGMGALGKRLRGRDVEIGMVLSFVLGLGVLFLSLYTGSANGAVSVLFGSILSVTRTAALITLVTGLATLAVLIFLFRPLLFASIDPSVAEPRGIPVRALAIVFLLLLAVSVSQAVQVVGVLLIFTLLIVPAAAAELLTRTPLATILLAVAISLVSTWTGLVLAFLGRAPVSFYIVAISSLCYFTARGIRHFRAPRRYRQLPHPSREVQPPAE